jgi:hypothetical protein
MAEAATALKWGWGAGSSSSSFGCSGRVDQPGRPRRGVRRVGSAGVKDLTLYQERAPGNMEYDTRAKRYVAAETSSCASSSRTPTSISRSFARSPRALCPRAIRGLRRCPAPMWR